MYYYVAYGTTVRSFSKDSIRLLAHCNHNQTNPLQRIDRNQKNLLFLLKNLHFMYKNKPAVRVACVLTAGSRTILGDQKRSAIAISPSNGAPPRSHRPLLPTSPSIHLPQQPPSPPSTRSACSDPSTISTMFSSLLRDGFLRSSRKGSYLYRVFQSCPKSR